MAKKDPKIIRVGDQVKIINPDFFIRCGYPLSFHDAYDIVKEEYKDRVVDFIKNLSLPYKTSLDSKITDAKLFTEIAKAVTYSYVNAKGYGGKERKIYSAPIPNFKDEIVIIKEIKFVVTGTYVSGGYTYYDDDYDPPYLDDQKVHKILQVSSFKSSFWFAKAMEYDLAEQGHVTPDWIEAKNVEKQGVNNGKMEYNRTKDGSQ